MSGLQVLVNIGLGAAFLLLAFLVARLMGDLADHYAGRGRRRRR